MDASLPPPTSPMGMSPQAMAYNLRLSGNPYVDMMLVSVLSGLLLQHVPLLNKLLSEWVHTVVRLLVALFFRRKAVDGSDE